MLIVIFFFQAEDGIRDLVRSRGLGDVYKRQTLGYPVSDKASALGFGGQFGIFYNSGKGIKLGASYKTCLLYTSDAADERSSVDLGGRRIIKKKSSNED